MTISLLTTNSLRALHQAIHRAMAHDDALPLGQKLYLVREYPDWRAQADQIESELSTRRAPYWPLAW